ncbi:hypothetical protein MVES1_001041 [Malassezia vespertilionis]|uniref:uncharacterized protein n=1 Tax=Malassezia vespertilionis TaxID=2020962 RepID=UPI0024B0F27D|nr:uncharacterized protein MVES1_001041 [Malassezia vespertilionis]WFD05708.1 hypothetical protein MVES1_001041 [Malassezia vespertilionis]
MAQSLAKWGIVTSEEFVKVLKRPETSKEALPNGERNVSRIEVLQYAWSDNTIYVPQKTEMLLDITLEAMLSAIRNVKGIDGLQHHNDTRYWQLLSFILSSPEVTPGMLHALVGKHSIFQLAMSAAEECKNHSTWEIIVSPLSILLPFSIRRWGASQIDTVNSLFQTVLHALPCICGSGQVDATVNLLNAMCKYWAPALELGTNAKKTSKFFLQATLLPFARALHYSQQIDAPALEASIVPIAAASLYEAAALDGPRSAQGLPDTLQPLTDALVQHIQDVDVARAMLCVIPVFLDQLVRRICGIDVQAPVPRIRQGVLEQYITPICQTLQQLPPTLSCAVAHARLLLVEKIAALKLYIPGGEDQEAWSALWRILCKETLVLLDFKSSTLCVTYCFTTFTVLWRVDMATLEELLPSMLSTTCNLPKEMECVWEAAHNFVSEVVVRYAESRNMLHLFGILQQVMDRTCVGADPTLFATLAQSPLLEKRSVVNLSSLLQNAVPPGQVLPMLSMTLENVQQRFVHVQKEPAPVLFSAHFLMLVIQNVGLDHLLNNDAYFESMLKMADSLVECGLQKNDMLVRACIAAGLRLRFVLVRRAFVHAQCTGQVLPPMFTSYTYLDQLVPFFASKETIPQVRAEILRTAFACAEVDLAFNARKAPSYTFLSSVASPFLFDALHMGSISQFSAWDGQLFGLIDSADLPSVLWRMITGRWARVMDACMNVTQLCACIEYMQKTLLASPSDKLGGHQKTISETALKSAQFFELSHWREAIVQQMEESVAWIDPSKAPRWKAGANLEATLAAINMLERLPIGIFPSSSLDRIVSCLAWLDAAWTLHGLKGDTQVWTALKLFLSRAASTTTVCFPIPISVYILAMVNKPSCIQKSWERASVHLLSALFSAPDAIEHVLHSDTMVTLSTSNAPLAQHILAILLEHAADATIPLRSLPANLGSSTLEKEVMSAFAKMHEEMDDNAFCLARLRILHASEADVSSAALIFDQLLNSIETIPFAAQQEDGVLFATALFSCLSTLRFYLHGQKGKPYVALCMAYSSLSAKLNGSELLTHRFVQAIMSMDQDSYASTLETLELPFLRKMPECTIDDMSSLLSVMSILLQHAPSGTSKIASARFASMVVRLPSIVTQAPMLSLAATEMVRRVCQYRALILRSADVAKIFAFFGVLLRPAGTENKNMALTLQANTVYQGIVASLCAIVRFRKDLLSPLLPHLTALLSSLLLPLLSLLRSNTGRAPLRTLAETTPCWLDVVSSPLGLTEARSLSRLYTEISTKTTSIATMIASKKRKLTSDAIQVGTTETLGRSMTKHAIYVLVAYVRLVAQRTSTIAAPLRQALLPGLFALCSIISEYERDAALKGMLDASGQAVFKSLWKEWEHERYKGT